MKFTFGIITGGEDRVNKIINSIINLNIKDYEIIIIGGDHISGTRHIKFETNRKRPWITKMKNIITENAIFENIVYLHDYIKFNSNWYKGFLDFGDDWNVCMTKIINNNDSRYRDWIVEENFGGTGSLLPYNIRHASGIMYISGAYWIAKKHVMEEFPLNEKLHWGEGEDVEWSHRVRNKYEFSINSNSSVKLMKQKTFNGKLLSKDSIKKINNKSYEDLIKLGNVNHNKHLPGWIRNKL